MLKLFRMHSLFSFSTGSGDVAAIAQPLQGAQLTTNSSPNWPISLSFTT